MSALPIADYALLSDRHTAALVSSGGSVDWLCLPRFDSPAVFARLLDAHAGGFAVCPTDPGAEVTRRYLDGTMVLDTTFRTTTGTLVLRDALATGPASDPHRLGAAAPRMLVRALTCIAGEVEVGVEFTPRPEYAVITPLVSAVDGGILVRGGADVLLLCCPIPLEIGCAEATGRFRMRKGERTAFGLVHRSTSETPPEHFATDDLEAAMAATIDAWRSWSQIHQGYEGPWQGVDRHGDGTTLTRV